MTSIKKKSVCKKIRITPLTSVNYWCGIYKQSVTYGLRISNNKIVKDMVIN